MPQDGLLPKVEGEISNAPDGTDIPIEISGILDALPFYVILLDNQHCIIWANKAVQKQFGVDPNDLIGKHCPALIHGQNEPWYACPLEEAVQKGQPVEREALDKASGRWIRSAIYPTRRLTRDGRTIYFHMVSDITDRKQAEARAAAARATLKTYAAHVVTAQEEERQRIARELHDEAIQNLALLCRRLDAIAGGEPLSSSVIDELHKTREMAEGVIKGLRDFIRGLRPPILDDLGVVTSVRRLLLDFANDTGVRSQIKVSGKERRLPLDTEVGLFRIAQEALWNVERHSKATEVVISITFTEHQTRLDISDNGVGFNVHIVPEDLFAGSHFGLLGMHERAELFGGKLEIQSSPGKGTTITVSTIGKQ